MLVVSHHAGSSPFAFVLVGKPKQYSEISRVDIQAENPKQYTWGEIDQMKYLMREKSKVLTVVPSY